MRAFLDSVTIYLPDGKKKLSKKGIEHFNEFLAEYGLKLSTGQNKKKGV